ncbi:ankyrin repeat domain-containing protein SOWAHB [Triplophysa dalaica]|uniref:ankyrin repeat domain-containing protein SOWAHB n=1 Tax=Triplophysa dalaica TaxID=1582913 RepID=UPI0024E00034|nr:ankyrin repeat domain-containing protein SOWAHB [Triplophysa dalaica]
MIIFITESCQLSLSGSSRLSRAVRLRCKSIATLISHHLKNKLTTASTFEVCEKLGISVANHFVDLKFLTKEQPKPDLQSTTPAPAVVFTNVPTSSQRHSEINWTFQLKMRAHENLVKQRCNESECHDPEEGIPVVVVTQPDKISHEAEDTLLSVKHHDMVPYDVGPSDGTELNNSDLQSLKSDTVSLLSAKTDLQVQRYNVTAVPHKCVSDEQEGPEEDTRSVTASSVMSLFNRIQMDPMEKEWLRCAALGKAPALHILLQQDNTLVSRKTALHWAAKQGCEEMADMMARSGADVNQRAGYTPLHLASLHGHGNIIQLLINNYNAKVNIRDYHGKMAAHYWNGTMDIFYKYGSHSVGRWSGGRRVQYYAQLSAFLSRSHGNINVEMSAHSPLTRKSHTPTP